MSRSTANIRKTKFIDEKLVKEFLAKVEQKVEVSSLIVFGSRARGDALLTSDYDIAVISENFKDMPKFERIYLLLDNWEAAVPLEPIAFTPDEFSKAKGLLIWDMLEDGIVFKDTGVFNQRKKLHENLKKLGRLKKVVNGWKFV